MILAIGAVFLVLAGVGAEAHPQIRQPSVVFNELWFNYKISNNKTYIYREERSRRITWENHMYVIYWHNVKYAAGHYTFTLYLNALADLTSRQYLDRVVRLKASRNRRLEDNEIVALVHRQGSTCVPKSLDWRERGFVTEPENQLDCGSCYAYSIAGTISGQLFRRTGVVTDLSEQQLVDCSAQSGNLGCLGGSLRNTLRYLEKAKGIMADENYPYVAKAGDCKYQERLSVANITSWTILPARDERALEAAVATIGPIAASVNASPKTFQLYHSGVYDDPACTSDKVNHAMLIVGYTKNAWILKNWWGTGWGEDGYMRLRKGKNRCGIANYAGYAKI